MFPVALPTCGLKRPGPDEDYYSQSPVAFGLPHDYSTGFSSTSAKKQRATPEHVPHHLDVQQHDQYAPATPETQYHVPTCCTGSAMSVPSTGEQEMDCQGPEAPRLCRVASAPELHTAAFLANVVLPAYDDMELCLQKP